MLLKSIEERLSRFKKNRVYLKKLLGEFKDKPQGKVVGLNIPDAIRARVTEQVKIWNARSYRQLLHACLVIGLEEVEEMGRIQRKARDSEPPPATPPPSEPRPSVREFIDGIRNEGLVEEVQNVRWPDDSGDDEFPTPEGDEEELPR